MAVNLNKYQLVCPDCDGIDFIRSIRLEYGQSLSEKTGPVICVGCMKPLRLERAIRVIQVKMRKEDLAHLEEEIEMMEG